MVSKVGQVGVAVAFGDAARKALREERLFRGVRLCQAGHTRFISVRRGEFMVVSESDPNTRYYVVYRPERGEVSCGCADFQKRGAELGLCKHVACVMAWLGRIPCQHCGRPAGPGRMVCPDCVEPPAWAYDPRAERDFWDDFYGEPGR